MSRSRAKPTHSGFASFPDPATRERFIKSALDSEPALKSLAFIPENRPVILFENLSTPQRARIQSVLQSFGEWFDDVQFRPMA